MTLTTVPKNTKLETLVNYKVRVITSNSSTFIGTLLSYDKYMNVVLTECEEFRLLKKSKKYMDELNKDKPARDGDYDHSKIQEQKRLLGLILLRGENIISVVADSAPNSSTLKPKLRLKKGKVAVKPLKKKIGGLSDNKTGGGISKSK